MDDKNKPGKPKDISDLKARLGLARGAAAPTGAPPEKTQSTPPVSTPASPMGRPSSPPGVRGPLPAPPTSFPTLGAQTQPAPQAPADPRSNPFAAMSNAVAQPQALPTAYAAYADDGKPVARVGKSRLATMAITMGIAGAVGALLGYFGSVVSIDRSNYNRMIADAKAIKGEVEGLAGRLNTIGDALKRSSQKFPNNAPDFALIEALKAIDLQPPNQQKIFHTNYARLEDIVMDELFNYYNDSIALYEQIGRHIKASEKEKQLLTAYAKQAKTQDVNYGVVIEQGKINTSKLVQIVNPICKGGKGDCNNVSDLEGFLVTFSPGQTPFAAKLTGSGTRVVPLEHTQMLDSMVAGAKPEAIAANDYKRRLGNIRMLASRLLQVQGSLLGHLDTAAKKPRL